MTSQCSIRLIHSISDRTCTKLCVRSLGTINNFQVKKAYERFLLKSSPPFLTSARINRNFSMQGFVGWQENLYSNISQSSAVEVIQTGLLNLHDTTGLPWWATIILSTIILRSIMTLPLAIYQNYITAKVENASYELKELIPELKKETAVARHALKLTDRQTSYLFRKSLKKQWKIIIERDNCHPFKASLVIWLQIPIWVCTSFAIRNLVYMQPVVDAAAMITVTELAVGGFGWIPNLTQPDASWILPVAYGILNLSIIEIQNMSKIRTPSKLHTIFTNCFRGFSIIMVPIGAYVPSCMCLYWVTSSSFGLVQNLVLLSPKLRRKVGILEVPSELEEPYTHIRNEIKHKLHIGPKRISSN